MAKNEWRTFTSASLNLEKSRTYLQSHFRKNPQYFKEGTFKKDGRIWLISEEGVEEVLKHIKKLGDRLRILPLKAVYKTKKHLCFYPTHHYIKIAIN